MKLGEICNREVVFVRRAESALEASKLMRQYHVGDLVVVEERGASNVPVGIITDRDLVVQVLAREVDPQSVSAGDLAVPDALVTASSEEDLQQALDRMRSRGIRRLPVVDETGALVGILAMDDILELLAEQVEDLVALIARQIQRESVQTPS